MTIDVENLRNRRNDGRWNRVSVGDVIERVTRDHAAMGAERAVRVALSVRH